MIAAIIACLFASCRYAIFFRQPPRLRDSPLLAARRLRLSLRAFDIDCRWFFFDLYIFIVSGFIFHYAMPFSFASQFIRERHPSITLISWLIFSSSSD
jgi:hypothetical protein